MFYCEGNYRGQSKNLRLWPAKRNGEPVCLPEGSQPCSAGWVFYSACARKFSASCACASLLEHCCFAELTNGWHCGDGLGSDAKEGDITCCQWDVRLSGPAASHSVYGLSEAFPIFSKVFPPRAAWKQNDFICEGSTPMPSCSFGSVASMEGGKSSAP